MVESEAWPRLFCTTSIGTFAATAYEPWACRSQCALAVLKLVPRLEFEELVLQTQAERATKGLSSWSQFVAMMFCQLGRAHSLREISGGLKSCEGKLETFRTIAQRG